jgi:hypothetical protein
MGKLNVCILSLIIIITLSHNSVQAGRHHQNHNYRTHQDFRDRFGPIVSAAASQHVSQVCVIYAFYKSVQNLFVHV